MKVLNGLDGLDRAPVLEPNHLRPVSQSVNAPELVKVPRTDPLLRHPRKRLAHISANRRARRLGDELRRRVLVQLKLDPHDEMDDARIDGIRPVIPQDLDVVVALERRRAARDDGAGPVEPVGQNKVEDAVRLLPQAPGELAVPAQLRRRALEQVEAARGHFLAGLGPRVPLELVLGRGDDGAVLVAEADEVDGARVGSLRGGDVDVPVRRRRRRRLEVDQAPHGCGGTGGGGLVTMAVEPDLI